MDHLSDLSHQTRSTVRATASVIQELHPVLELRRASSQSKK